MNCRKWLENKVFMRLRGNNEFHVIYRSFTLFLWKWGQINRALVCKQKGRKEIVLLFLIFDYIKKRKKFENIQ